MRLQVEEQTNCLGVGVKEVAGDHLCSLPPTEWDRNTGGKPRTGSRRSLVKSTRKVQQTQTQVSSFFPMFLSTEAQLMVRPSQHLTTTEQQLLLI